VPKHSHGGEKRGTYLVNKAHRPKSESTQKHEKGSGAECVYTHTHTHTHIYI